MSDPRVELVGDKADHYIPIFDDLDEKGGSIWNWCGFLFYPMWFAYRKMYGWSAISIVVPRIIVFLIVMIAVFASASDTTIDVLARILGIVIAVIFGGMANSLYKRRIDKLVREMPTDEHAKALFIKQKGGVSLVGMIIALVINMAIGIGLTVLGSTS